MCGLMLSLLLLYKYLIMTYWTYLSICLTFTTSWLHHSFNGVRIKPLLLCIGLLTFVIGLFLSRSCTDSMCSCTVVWRSFFVQPLLWHFNFIVVSNIIQLVEHCVVYSCVIARSWCCTSHKRWSVVSVCPFVSLAV